MTDSERLKVLKNAISEANRFIKLSNVAIEKQEYCIYTKRPHLTGQYYATAKRSSMDLTRALANVRKFNYD